MKLVNNLEVPKDVKVAGYIYCISNNVDKMNYIGLTSNIGNRYRNYTYAFKNPKKGRHVYMMNHMRKIGIDNFKFEVIDYSTDIIELGELEKKYIKEMNSKFPYGFNMTSGGEHNSRSRPQSITEKVVKSKSIIAYNMDENKFIFSDSAKLFADKVGLARTNVTEAIKKYKKARGYICVYLNNSDRLNLKNDIEAKIKTLGPKHKHHIDTNLKFIWLCELIDLKGLNYIKENYEVEVLGYIDEDVETIKRHSYKTRPLKIRF